MATTQNLMLENIRMEYHSFRQDQVLTHKQLNDLIEYFEDQDRLTRTCLTGVGLVCGLKIKHTPGAEPFIELSSGCAVTTDGDLLTSDPRTYRHFRPYTNTKKGTDSRIYDPFYPPNNNDKQIELWELTLPGNGGVLPERSKDLKDFTADTGKNLDALVAILYLEHYLQDPDKCTAIDCDNQGPHQIAAIRLLLLTKTDLDKIINRDPVDEVIYDSIYQKWNNASMQHNTLPLLKAKRVILNNFNTTSPVALKSSYTAILNNESGKLLSAIEQLYNTYKFLLDDNAAAGFDIIAFKQQLQASFLKNMKIQQSQYLYDFYKDMLDCYNELREAVFQTAYECMPDKHAFPKHIMLGEIKSSGTEPAPYRHLFYPSPAVTTHKEKAARCKTLWQRLLSLAENLNIPEQGAPVKITPSTDYDQLLEKRSIPFYYKNAVSIVKQWSYSAARQKTEINILSYHGVDYAGGLDSTINPLDYDIDENNFLRIEGHLGKTLNQALTDIDKIRNNKSLPFDLIALRLEKNGNLNDIDPDDYDCEFDDLNTMLQTWLVEQQCLYANVASFFSGFNNRRDQGFHSNITKYKATEKPVAATDVEFRSGSITALKEKESFVGSESFTATKKIPGAISPVFLKGVFLQDKTVSKNLEKSSDAIGNDLDKLVKKPGLSKNDIIAEVERSRGKDPALNDLTVEEKEVVVSTPIRMVAEINELAKFNPQRLGDLNPNSIEAYKKRSELFCQYIKLLHDRMGQIFKLPAYKQNGFESYYLFILQEIITHCCAGKQLEVILKEVEKRKQKILESLLFANYAAQHPGMEHKAGVHRGGTFIILYTTESKIIKGNTIKKEVRDEDEKAFLEKILRKDDKKGDDNVYENIESLALFIFKHQGEVDISDEFEKYKDVNGIKDGSPQEAKDLALLKKYLQRLSVEFKEEEAREISTNMVIADFCLPYLCCSECPPIAFIVPKQQFNLSLPKAAACNDDDLLEFRREPFDGKVTADGFDNAIIINGSGVFFDPTKVAAANLGKEIQFKIEGQVTDCRITVFKHPAAKFEPKVTKDDATELTVEFKNLSDDDTGKLYTYEWNFGDNSPVVRVSNKDVFSRTYKKAFLESIGLIGTLPVKLVAINGPCSSSAEVPVKYSREEPVSLTLPVAVICNDADKVPFEPQPADGVVATTNGTPGVIKDAATGKFFFDPAQATVFATPIAFTVNGKPTSCIISVFKHPVPKFSTQTAVSGTTLQVTFTNQTETQPGGNEKFFWEMSDGQKIVKQDKAPFTMQFDLNVIRNTGNKLTAVLRVVNVACEGVSDIVNIALPAPPPVLCLDVTRNAIREDLNFFENIKFAELLKKIITDIQKSGPLGIPLPANQIKAAQLKALVSRFISLLKTAETDSPKFETQEAVRNNILKQLHLVYRSELLKNDFDLETNKAIIMLLVRAAWKTGLNVIRCVTALDGTGKEITVSMLGLTDQQIVELKRSMPELNKEDKLVSFVKNYQSAPVINDATIKNSVKEFGTNIKKHFQP